MSDRAFRLVLLGSLAQPLFMLAYVLDSAVSQSAWNPFGANLKYFLFEAGLVGLAGAVWRAFVRWTHRRRVVVGLVSLPLLTHAAFGRPMWNLQSCGMEDTLLYGQQFSLVGLWGIGVALAAWWALLRRRPIASECAAQKGTRPMSLDAARLCIGLSMLPLLSGFHTWSEVTLGHFFPNTASAWREAAAHAATAIVAVTIWLLTWRGRVDWTPERKRVTALLALFLIGSCGLFVRGPLFESHYVGLFLLGISYPLWFAGTAFVWRSRRPAIDDELCTALAPEPRCPVCSYSLVGLREVRCPECGWSSTVDQVIEHAWRERVELMRGV